MKKRFLMWPEFLLKAPRPAQRLEQRRKHFVRCLSIPGRLLETLKGL
jgi:hypothetical protein